MTGASRPPTVLVVEDNLATQKMIRVVLQSAGYLPLEARDGRTALDVFSRDQPDLVLQDLLLPDMDGFELVKRLRALPGGEQVPILAFSGLVSNVERLKLTRGDFDDFVAKPIEASRLLEVIADFLPRAPAPEASGWGRLLLVDDDPIQRKLFRLRLAQIGFAVSAAVDGVDALEQLRRDPTDIVVSDVMMPRLDGFGLCRAIRGEPRFAALPVVLVSSTYVEDKDIDLSRKLGANAMVVRTPDGKEVIEAVLACLNGPTAPPAAPLQEGVTAEYAERLARQLERQAMMNERLTQRCAMLTAELSVLGGIAEVLTRTANVESALTEILARCLDASGLSIGALYLRGADGRLRLAAQTGWSESPPGAGDTITGETALLERALESARPMLVSSTRLAPEATRSFLEKARATAALIVPMLTMTGPVGVLVLMSTRNQQLTEDEWIPFARTVGAQIADAIEQRRLQAHLAQTDKLAAMGTLLAGVAHELNNPLSVVIGQTVLLQRSAPDRGTAERAEKIARAAERCGRIVKSFLSLARQRAPERCSVSLNQVARDAVELLAYPLRVDDIEVALELDDGLPGLFADPHELHQVVVNLVSNAHDAMRETPPPRRLVVNTRFEARERRAHLEVADTGPGIAPDVVPRLFEPFFTTKPIGRGTGLGLSLCRGIVESHGGTISVESTPGHGARFHVDLPLGVQPAVPVVAGTPEVGSQDPSRAILVVDDEAEVAGVLAEMLALDGHRVDVVSSGEGALAKLRERPYELILCDMRMPELDGVGFFEQATRHAPALGGRIVMLTGDTLSPETARFFERTRVAKLDKPFALDEVRRVVRAVLGR